MQIKEWYAISLTPTLKQLSHRTENAHLKRQIDVTGPEQLRVGWGGGCAKEPLKPFLFHPTALLSKKIKDPFCLS